MSMFTVTEKCTKCGLCAELCMSGIIQMENNTPRVAAEDEAKCMQCGQCVAFCPVSACALAYQPASDRAPINAAIMPGAEALETFLRSRRSVRRYKSEPVDGALLARILETCRYAPTASNSQLVRWIVTKDVAKTKELAAMTVDFYRGFIAKNPDNPMASKLGSVIKLWDSGHDIIFRGAPQLAVAVFERQHEFSEDAAIALTYFELAAHANKIGCCWAGFFTRAARQSAEMQKALGIKDNEIIVGGQMFGYPQGLGLSHALPPRKKVDLVWL